MEESYFNMSPFTTRPHQLKTARKTQSLERISMTYHSKQPRRDFLWRRRSMLVRDEKFEESPPQKWGYSTHGKNAGVLGGVNTAERAFMRKSP
jgi:hypothetical protein